MTINDQEEEPFYTEAIVKVNMNHPFMEMDSKLKERAHFPLPAEEVELVSPPYSAYVKQISYGKALFASEKLEPNTVVARFEGPAVNNYEEIPNEERTYALLCPSNRNERPVRWHWIITKSDAKYSNHACLPNCYLDAHQQLRTLLPVEKDTELTWIYNRAVVPKSKSLTDRGRQKIAEESWWDPLWSFDCCCGAVACMGRVDRYFPVDVYGRPVVEDLDA